jgi:hypothetical protein
VKWLACIVLCSGCDFVFGLEAPVAKDAAMTVDAPVDAGFDPNACGPSFAGTRHLYFPESVTWLVAEGLCEILDPDPNDGTYVHLAVLTTLDEIGTLAALPINGEAWVGLTNGRLTAGGPPMRSEFEWITLEETIAVPWNGSDPDSPSSPPINATFDAGDTNIHDSTSPHSYICECDGFAPLAERVTP